MLRLNPQPLSRDDCDELLDSRTLANRKVLVAVQRIFACSGDSLELIASLSISRAKWPIDCHLGGRRRPAQTVEPFCSECEVV